jgi:2,5-diketo-D-gluconate reductase A
VVNQVELHPWLPQAQLREFDESRGIRTEAWSPLARGRILATPLLDDLAAKHGRTPAQIVLRWHIELGNIVIPKASSPERLRENLDVFDYALDPEDLALIASLETGERTGRDPDLD